jgi:large subunit ribosomal protein L9
MIPIQNKPPVPRPQVVRHQTTKYLSNPSIPYMMQSWAMPSAKAKTNKKNRQKSSAKRLPKGRNGGIELLLIQSVDHVGRQGDVVEVKPGFANNYLLPQGLATIASDHHKRMVEKHKAKLLEIEMSRLTGLRDLAAIIARQSITIEANANDEGHLYGSVGATEIINALKQNDIHLSVDQIRLEGVLKELGLYTVKVHLHQEVESDLKVWVVPTVEADVAQSRKESPDA